MAAGGVDRRGSGHTLRLDVGQQGDRVQTLLIDLVQLHELAQAGGVHPRGLGIGEQLVVTALREEASLAQVDQLVVLELVNHPGGLRGPQCGADVHHRLGQRPVAVLVGGVGDRDLVVVGERTGHIGIEDLADPDRTVDGRLRDPQRTHTAGPVHRHALFQRVEDLLVPHRQILGEHPVNQQQRFRVQLVHDRQDVGLGRGRHVDGIGQDLAGIGHWHRRTEEHDQCHPVLTFWWWVQARARAPGVKSCSM